MSDPVAGGSSRGPSSLLGRGDVWPALVIAAAAALLVMPVPAGAVDLLLSLNLAFAITLLLLAVRVGGALKVAAFPTMLLVATLFRLALNVSTTRLILAEGDAGAVVRSFGDFVASGNALVGGVLFLILTVVQYIVIAKGSERVAEVTARFTLDALPGKQMSIDADLRAGLIDQQGAQRRRSELEREAQFHGSMDGAMKFVKGDALAGMAITLVNLAGGLAVGCLQRGLSVDQAVSRYTLLTIGDGLASQVPALLLSVAAGLVVTRVRGERADRGLGSQMVDQLTAHPEVLLFGGLCLAAAGLVPGMPLLAFGLLGAILVGLGLGLDRRHRLRAAAPAAEAPGGTVLELQLGPAAGRWSPLLPAIKAGVERDLGVRLPQLVARAEGREGCWCLAWQGLPVATGELAGGGEAAGRAALEAGLRRIAPRFVGVQETQDMLDELEREQPALVREVVPRLVPPVVLAEVLARLVEEQVPVRDLRGILACLAEWARSEAEPMVLAERVREHLRPVISHRVAPAGELTALLVDPAIEQRLQAALQAGGGPGTLALEPEAAQAILHGVERALADCRGEQAAVLCQPGLRRAFWKLVSPLYPRLRVIGFNELDPNLVIRPLGRICAASGGSDGEAT